MTDIRWQVDRYVALGYPRLAGLSDAQFRTLAEPLTDAAETRGDVTLVVTRELIDPEERVPLLRLSDGTKQGILDKNHFSDARAGLAPYDPRPELALPSGPLYLLEGFDRGDRFRGVAPRDTRAPIAAAGRTPLTIDEGLSVLALDPGVLAKNHCFMLDGSTRGDKRVPALWISTGAPKLGWCFDGVPHDWLGMASASARHP
ncbi:MAG: DUF5701 family protein [Actinomycetes bacterium]